MKVKLFKNNFSWVENMFVKKIFDENLFYILIEEMDFQKNKRKEIVKDVKNLVVREGMNLLNSFCKILSVIVNFFLEFRNLYFFCLFIIIVL